MTTLWPASVESASDRLIEALGIQSECVDGLVIIVAGELSSGEREGQFDSELIEIRRQINVMGEVLYDLKRSFPTTVQINQAKPR